MNWGYVAAAITHSPDSRSSPTRLGRVSDKLAVCPGNPSTEQPARTPAFS